MFIHVHENPKGIKNRKESMESVERDDRQLGSNLGLNDLLANTLTAAPQPYCIGELVSGAKTILING